MKHRHSTPDYAVPPGWILAEYLEVHGISQVELAQRCDLSPKLVREIIGGSAAVNTEIALRFEKIFGLDASVWTGIEAAYRLHPGSVRQSRDQGGG